MNSIANCSVRWEERDDVVLITLPPSSGITGEGWIYRFEKQRVSHSEYVKRILRSRYFVPTTGVIHRLVVIRASLWTDHLPQVWEIEKEGFVARKFTSSHPEAMCILRDSVSDEELLKARGFYSIVGMHGPVKSFGDWKRRLTVEYLFDRATWYNVGSIEACGANPGKVWANNREQGFAFGCP